MYNPHDDESERAFRIPLMLHSIFVKNPHNWDLCKSKSGLLNRKCLALPRYSLL